MNNLLINLIGIALIIMGIALSEDTGVAIILFIVGGLILLVNLIKKRTK
jgi:uncharacterized membrane protein YtjA (UPF0391 family)